MSSHRWSPRIGKYDGVMGGRSAVNQSDRDVDGLLPTGTVTLLAAEVEDSSRLREAEPDQMGVVALLDDAVWDMVAAHHG
ncbi:MAG: hypothetical protein WBW75_17305, partial [Mycobacterium sp.]